MKNDIHKLGEFADQGDGKKVGESLDSLLGMLLLKIDKACELPNLASGVVFEGNDLTDCYVLVNSGQRPRDCPKTRVIKDDLDPIWNEEFLLDIPPELTHLTLELWDCNSDQWTGSKRESIGSVRLDFRSHAGRWVQKRAAVNLTVPGRKGTKPTLEYRFFFATSIRQLMEMEMGSIEPDAAPMEGIRSVSAFLRDGI